MLCLRDTIKLKDYILPRDPDDDDDMLLDPDPGSVAQGAAEPSKSNTSFPGVPVLGKSLSIQKAAGEKSSPISPVLVTTTPPTRTPTTTTTRNYQRASQAYPPWGSSSSSRSLGGTPYQYNRPTYNAPPAYTGSRSLGQSGSTPTPAVTTSKPEHHAVAVHDMKSLHEAISDVDLAIKSINDIIKKYKTVTDKIHA